MARPPLVGWRLVVISWTPPLLLAGLMAVQWWVTSPADVTYTEFRLMLLAAGVALPVTLCARWIDAAPRITDYRRERP